MTDPIGVRNIIVQTSVAEKIQQVQQHKGDLYQQAQAYQSLENAEKAAREVATSKESSEARLKNKREQEEKQRQNRKDVSQEKGAPEDRQDASSDPDLAQSGRGVLIDIKV